MHGRRSTQKRERWKCHVAIPNLRPFEALANIRYGARMQDHVQIYYTGPPRVSDYRIFGFVLAAAVGATVLAASATDDTTIGYTDLAALWVIALASWFGPILAGRYLQNRKAAYSNREPAITCDGACLGVRAWTGKLITIPWSEIKSFELEEKNGRSFLLLHTSKDNGSVSLDGLSDQPQNILRSIQQISRRIA